MTRNKRRRKAANSDHETLSPPLLDKLSKVLGMLGSAHDGEVLAAGRRAHIMVSNAGWTWPALLGMASTARNSEPPSQHNPPPPPPPPSPECQLSLEMVLACIAAPTSLYEPYETGFLASILPQLRRGRELSDKQLAWLCRLHERALHQAGAKT
jgi:hypothetical protein